MAPEGVHSKALTKPVHQFARVTEHDVEGFAEVRWINRLAGVEYIRQIPKQPGPPKTTTTDNNAVTPGLPHHAQRVLRFPYVAIAEHGNFQRLLELRDGRPVGMPVIKLGGGTRVQTHSSASLVFRH